jgi:hypothetical protein
LVQKKKITIFDPIKVALFTEQCGVSLVYILVALVEIYKNYTLCPMVSHIITM